METNLIKPPKDKWIGNRDPERLRLEYFHGAKFLDLIFEEDNLIRPQFKNFPNEKKSILEENKHRNFSKESESPELTKAEITALTPIILDYSRAKEYLHWFLDFNQYKDINSFTIDNFRNFAKPIYLKKETDKKAAEEIYRLIDNKSWKIPYQETIVDINKDKIIRTNDYTRPATYVFPTWFTSLNIINRIPILKEFKFKEGNWEMHYPITDNLPDLDLFEDFILKKFNNKNKTVVTIWIPNIIYESALFFRIPIKWIKKLLIQLYEKNRPKYILDRSSLQVSRYSNQLRNQNLHKELFINYKDFLRTNFTINNGRF